MKDMTATERLTPFTLPSRSHQSLITDSLSPRETENGSIWQGLFQLAFFPARFGNSTLAPGKDLAPRLASSAI